MKLSSAKMVRRYLLILSANFVALPCLADGQIRIQVIDNESRRAVENARLTVTPRKGPAQEYTLEDNGQRLIEGLEAGLYEVNITRKGYFPFRLPSVRVIDNKTTPLKAELVEAKGVEEVLVLGVLSSQDMLSGVSSGEKDREALRSAAGGGADVLRSLDGLPGLFSDGGFSTYTVRGNSPRNNLILVDGIPFENVVHFRNAFGQDEELEGGGRYSVFAPNIISSAKFQPGGLGTRLWWASGFAVATGSGRR